MTASIRLGSRRNPLALAQTAQVAASLERFGCTVEIVALDADDVAEARRALRDGACEAVVHSLKQVPLSPEPGLVIAAVAERLDAGDAIVTRDGTPLHAFAPAATVGVESARRRVQVKRHNPRVEVVETGGGFDERLARVRNGELDAVILGAAPLYALGALDDDDLWFQFLGAAEWPTVPAQGVLAIETREDADAALTDALRAVDHPPTRIAAAAERAAFEALDADEDAAVGIHADLQDDELRLRAIAYSPDGRGRIAIDHTELLGTGYIRRHGSGDGADAADGVDPMTRASEIGSAVAHRLLERGAADLVRPRE